LGDENNRAIGAGGVDGPLHVALADGVERGGAIVQDENGRVFEEDTDQCQPLPLPAGKVLTALRDFRVVTPGHGHDLIVQTSIHGSVANVLEGFGTSFAVFTAFHKVSGARMSTSVAETESVAADKAAGHHAIKAMVMPRHG